jgi:uncharacterized protein (TIGR04222 family)
LIAAAALILIVILFILVSDPTNRHRDITGTWLDAFDFLDLISGQPFIFFFAAYAALMLLSLKLLGMWFLPHVEGVSLLDLGDQVRFELKPNFLELAYLKGGYKAAIEAALCNLHRLGIIDSQASQHRTDLASASSSRFHPLERAIALALASGTPAHSLAGSRQLAGPIANFETAARTKLRRVGLFATRATYRTTLIQIILALLFIEGLGIIRLTRSLMRGYSNVALLVILLILALVAIYKVFKPWRTAAGTQYIQQMKRQYLPLSRNVQSRRTRWDGPEVLYAVAVFGAAALSGTGYASVHAALQPPVRSSSCSGCGGGGCGGGGCGGGGCGGGGCGGG